MTGKNLDGARRAARVVLDPIKQVSDPDRGRQAYRDAAFLDAINIDADPEHAELVVAEADRGNADAIDVVRQAVARRLIDGEPLPEPFLTFTLRILIDDDVKADGRRNRSHFMRDPLIIVAVNAVRAYGFHVTRNREAGDDPSACSIVAEVMSELGVHMTERNVEEVYGRRRVPM